LTPGEGEKAQTINESHKLYLGDVLVSRAAFHIYKGNFTDAEGLLKKFISISTKNLEDYPGLIKAIQAQLPDIPKSLKKILSVVLRRISIQNLETLERQRFLYENKEVFEWLLKGHPLYKRKLNKAIKDVLPFAKDTTSQEDDASKEKDKEKVTEKKEKKKKKKGKEKEKQSSTHT
jgi:hypothetical protein